ncbi:MAG: hypothetical protein V4616_01630, partial [Bacteroidota bacterium]
MDHYLLRSLKEKYLSPFILGLVIVLSVTAVLYANRAPEQHREGINPAFATYISGYTSGSIPRDGSIRIQFTHLPEKTIENDALNHLFSFEPGIKGKTTWVDSLTLEFKPAEWLPSGKAFSGTLELRQLFNTPDSLDVFPIQFQTIKQSFEIDPPVLEASDPITMTFQRLSAGLLTADVEDAAKVEEIVSVEVNGRVIPLKWEHAIDHRTHRFVADSIERLESEGKIELKWNGSSISSPLKGETSLKIPALGDFSVASITAFDEEEQYISVRFTDPLMVNQNLEGLISVGNFASKDLRYTIERNEIRAFLPNRVTGSQQVKVSAGIMNVAGYKMPLGYTEDVTFTD